MGVTPSEAEMLKCKKKSWESVVAYPKKRNEKMDAINTMSMNRTTFGERWSQLQPAQYFRWNCVWYLRRDIFQWLHNGEATNQHSFNQFFKLKYQYLFKTEQTAAEVYGS